MIDEFVKRVAAETSISLGQVKAAATLLEEGATVPFIARYRKEVTGGLDEVQIITIRDRLEQIKELEKRREAILASIEEQGKLTDDLKKEILAALTLSKLEDLYLPYRPKRKTKASIAKEKGLEPLALSIFEQNPSFEPEEEAKKYISEEVETVEDALQGARDIIAETINEEAVVRDQLRNYFQHHAKIISKVVKSKAQEKDAQKYKDYFEWEEPAKDAPSHRILAIRRGAEEGFLSYRVQPEEEAAMDILEKKFVKGNSRASKQVQTALEDAYKRLLSLSMETELRTELKKKADQEAIEVFAENLKELLLASPMGQKSTLALDPGLRTGCKLVCLDAQGNLIHTDTIYPLEPYKKTEESALLMKQLIKKYSIEAIAVGNGTGGREALDFCNSAGFQAEILKVMVNESGASVYSASEVAREEFPDHDLTVRGAVSIGRRLMDPLAELVKIDPKSIGVGQYQHDVDQRELKKSLDDVVVSCVNAVGVEVNTASKKLLGYVSGLSPRLAQAVVDHRQKQGAFKSRSDFKLVAGMGPKTFEQSAGFLRIAGAKNPLDYSAVHPERYSLVEKMAKDLNCTVSDLMTKAELRKKIVLENYIQDDIGLPTLKDIMDELSKPGRDPRSEFELFTFTEGINNMQDLQPGMKLPGVVTNVTNFGAFVDVGVHQDGLVHVSQLADHFVSDPREVVKVNQKVQVTVTEVDIDRKRISLSMKSDPMSEQDKRAPRSSGEKKTVRVKPRQERKDYQRKDPKQEQKKENSQYSEDNPFYQYFKNKK
jgi:uncharacterized protein